MIITRTPFRISFCGGGSDLPAFYEKNGGCVLSTSINKYMYISIHPFFDENKIALKYSQTEIVDGVDQIQHRIFKEALKQFGIKGVEITSTADVPSGTGLGSSSTFTVGLLNALNAYKGKYVSKGDLAENACDIEINRLSNPIGKQDQYAAAFGGLNFIEFLPNGQTVVSPVLAKKKVIDELQKRLVAFYTGYVHNANVILAEQSKNSAKKDKEAGLIKMCSLARKLRGSVTEGNLDDFGEILNENWIIKRELASGISSPVIDEYYDKAMKNGATGGKLLGAGGGGFLLFYCKSEEDKQRLISKMGLKPFPFAFDTMGTTTIFVGDKYWD